MVNVKKELILLLLVGLLSGCAPKDTATSLTTASSLPPSTSAETSAAVSTEAVPSTPTPLTYSVNNKGNKTVTGTLSDGTKVAAEILCSRDLENPGDASTYAIQMIPYSEKDRMLFVSPDWTALTKVEVKDTSSSESYLHGTLYYDTYSDTSGQTWSISTIIENIDYGSPRGELFSSLATSNGDIIEPDTDFSFATIPEAFSQASTFLTNAGFSIDSTYDVNRISASWMEQSEKMCEFYGDDTSAYKELYPNGLSAEDNAYLFSLRQKIDDLPALNDLPYTLLQNDQIPDRSVGERIFTFSGAKLLVTNLGVEQFNIGMRIQQGDVLQNKELCSLETALACVPTDLHTESTYEDVFVHIGSHTTGITTVVKAELGYILVISGGEYKGQARPCWAFELEWEDPKSTNPIYVKEHTWDFIDAYTGQHIPMTTASLEPI